MTITCIGHSGFVIESGERTLVFDYYVDPAGVMPDVLSRARNLTVFVSHSHRDHLCDDIFQWQGVTNYVIANECRRKLVRHIPIGELPITFMPANRCEQVDGMMVRTFLSTDAGVCFLVEVDGLAIFHAGDFNLWVNEAESPPEQVRKARGDFDAVLRSIAATRHIHVAMFPVIPNLGGDFAAGVRAFVSAIDVDVLLPMHTWGRDREASEPSLYPARQRVVMLAPGQSIDPGVCHC